MRQNNLMLLVLSIALLILARNNRIYAQGAFNPKKTKVLYVGYSPDKELPPNSIWTGASISDERYEDDMRSRMNEFETLLKSYYELVETVDARDYQEGMSDKFNVTIFDGLPKSVKKEVSETDPVTGEIKTYKKSKYLSDNFSNAAIFIAQNASALGSPIHLKTDWYCMCLYNYALEMNKDHVIFKEPLKVKLKMKNVDTPPELFRYPTGKDLPNKIPMWQVQTESSKDGKGYRTGMVSHGRPFMEAPDCEYISGGQCMKEITAASIARHGNFLLWGYAASPNYMTKGAQKTFINAVSYISRFNQKSPILRTTKVHPYPRSQVDYTIYTFSKQKYEMDAESTRQFVKYRLEEQQKSKEKQARGDKLNQMDKLNLNFKPYEPGTWESYLQEKTETPLVKYFKDDIPATIKFLEENKAYYTGGKVIEESIDEDAKSLGIPNNDPRILDAAISLLEKGKEQEKAKRILERYTLKEFTLTSEWREWYNTVKNYLFFSESAGYKFYIDSYNNPELYTEEIIGLEKLNVPETSETNPITSGAAILPTIDGNKALVVKVKIAEGYHVYASAMKAIPFAFFSAELNLPEEVKAFGDLRFPSVQAYEADPEIAVYRGELVLMQKITGETDKKISCKLNYQYCNKDMCSLPIEKNLVFEKPGSKRFNLSIEYDKAVDDTLRFSYSNLEGNQESVKIAITKGKGFFSSETCNPYWVWVGSTNFRNNGGFLLDYGDIALDFGTDNYRKEVKGSPTNDEYRNYRINFRKDLGQKYIKFTNLYIDARSDQRKGLKVNQDSVNYYYRQFKSFDELRKTEYIRANPDSYVSLALARKMYSSSVEYEKIKILYDLLSPRMQQTTIGEQLLQKVKAAKATAVGSLAPDFELTDNSGLSHRLSDYRGKYIFIDFYKWGCPPCEDLMQALKPIYVQFNHKGFEILGVYHRTDNNLESSKKRWAKLLEEHNPSWPNLFDMENKTCEDYGIESFPSSLLVAPDGTIISYEISASRLKKLLEEKLSSSTSMQNTVTNDGEKNVSEGKTLKSFTLKKIDSSDFSFSSLKGNYVLIDFWASWCGPCHKKMPELVELHKELENENFEILGISIDKKEEAWIADVKKIDVPWINVIDKVEGERISLSQFDVVTVPATFLIDPAGKIIKKNPTIDEVKKIVKR